MVKLKESEEKKSKRIYKSRKDKMIDGVCAGLADYLNADVKLVRILWILSVLVSGLGVVAYIVAMLIVPVNPEHAELKDDEKTKSKPGLYWGIGLILFGLFFIMDEWHPFHSWDFPHHFRFGRWWDFHWEMYWPVLLIAAGVIYIVFIMRKKHDNEEAADPKATHDQKQGKLLRSRKEKIVGGVCGGIAKHFKIDPNLIRIGFAVCALLTNLVLWLAIYLVFLVVVPLEDEEQTD